MNCRRIGDIKKGDRLAALVLFFVTVVPVLLFVVAPWWLK